VTGNQTPGTGSTRDAVVDRYSGLARTAYRVSLLASPETRVSWCSHIPAPGRACGYSLSPDLGELTGGRRRRNSLPSPGLLSTSIRARRACAALRAMAKPSPEPPVARSLASFTR
jgi:hypothetical protein